MDDERYRNVEEDDAFDEEADFYEPQPYWSPRRILFTIILLISLIAFLAYSLQGLFIQPVEQPTPTRVIPMI